MMVVRVLLVLLGAFHLLNGLWMLASPESWYAAIPGVVQSGPLNHHFVEDVGMAFIASGGLLILGSTSLARASAFAIAGATWPILHALIHIAGWTAHGMPRDRQILASEAIGVVALAILGGALAWVRTTGDAR